MGGNVVAALVELQASIQQCVQKQATTGSSDRILVCVPEWVSSALHLVSGPEPPLHELLKELLAELLGPMMPRPLVPELAQNEDLMTARQKFAQQRYAVLPPKVWGLDKKMQQEFIEMCQSAWSQMTPDIAPYTEFRDVGYARFRYYRGDLHPLLHKPFFQIDPAVNVLLSSKPRPFNRVPNDVREHPILFSMLKTLLEQVWNNELGDEVHVNIHPVRIRNFYNGKLNANQLMETTKEGTHTDSTERVAVVMIERKNVREGLPRTSLYAKECPLGKRRDDAADEVEIGPLRITEHVLAQPLEAITFDDTAFKHDAENIVPEMEGEECHRCVLLIMCRTPVRLPSPIDGHDIDGLSPRSSLSQRQCGGESHLRPWMDMKKHEAAVEAR